MNMYTVLLQNTIISIPSISISVGTLNEVQFPIEVIFALIAGTVVSAFAYMIIHSCLKKHRFKKQPPKGTCLIASIIVTIIINKICIVQLQKALMMDIVF